MSEQLSEESNEELSGDSIEILELDDDSLDAATVRKSFRIPVREKNSFLIVIRGTSFPIEDINSKGAGVLMVKDQSFRKGQKISDCKLILGKDTFHGVECQIVHITYIKGATPRFGIKWLNMDKKDIAMKGTKQIEAICNDLKKDLLEDSRQELEDDDLMQG